MLEKEFIQSREIILEYFEKALSFGSLFIISHKESGAKILAKLKHINDALNEFALVPYDESEQASDFPVGSEVTITNESSNVFLDTVVHKNHAHKWLTFNLPSELKVVNLRIGQRYKPIRNLSPNNWIISYGEEGLTKKSQYEGEILDISTNGMSLKIKARRLDGLYRGDQVEVNISEEVAALSRVKGSVVHKSSAKVVVSGEFEKYIKVGIRFSKDQVIEQLI